MAFVPEAQALAMTWQGAEIEGFQGIDDRFLRRIIGDPGRDLSQGRHAGTAPGNILRQTTFRHWSSQ